MLTRVNPMLCEPAAAFDDDNYLFEVKFDGERAVLFMIQNPKAVTIIQNRRGVDITYRYPEIQNLNFGRNAVLDGEIVVFDEQGVSNFDRLSQRSHLQKAFDIELRMKKIPVTFMAFDLLELDGEDLMQKPLHERKRLLYQEFAPIPGRFEFGLALDKEGKGKALFEMAKVRGLEGLVGKHIDSPYLQGKRSSYWKKIKNTKTVDVVFVKYEVNPAGIRLESADGTPCQCSGRQSHAVKAAIDRDGQVLVEVKYLNKTAKNDRLRMPTFVKMVLS
jgi:ATP-dependent DNA ligase